MEFKVLAKKRHDGAFQMARNGWLADYNDATPFWLWCVVIRTKTPKNCNREAEALIQKGNPEHRSGQAQGIADPSLQNDHGRLPIIPLVQYSLPRLVKSYVGGYSEEPAWTTTAAKTSTSSSTETRAMWVLHPSPRVWRRFRPCWSSSRCVTCCCMLTPGGPFDTERKVSAAVLANLQAKYHLDLPLWQQYLLYLKGLLQGDLGASFRYADWSSTIWSPRHSRIPGHWRHRHADWRPYRRLPGHCGRAANRTAWPITCHAPQQCGQRVSVFVIGPVLIMVFAILGWLARGRLDNFAPRFMVLPIALLIFINVSTIARVMRGSLIEVMHSNFIRTARAKGLPMPRVV
jgi:hypothetical protein